MSDNIVHIHGRLDRLLPIKFVKADIVVNEGGHLMIVENSAAISQILKNIIAATD